MAPTAEMKALLEHSDRSIIILDRDFRILWFNGSASKGMYSFYGEELRTGTSYWDYVDEDRNKRFIRNFNATLKGRKISTEQRVIKPGMKQVELWIEGRFSLMEDKDGNVNGVIYSYINISDRIRAERDEIERANVMQAIDHNDSQAFILIDEDDRILSCNMLAPTMMATLADPDDPYGLNVVKCIHPDWKERFESGLKVARSGGTVAIEFEQPGPDRNVIEIRFTPVKDRLGKKNMVSIWAFDITDKKIAEHELKQSEKNLRDVFNSSAHSFYLLDREGTVLAFNKASEKLVMDVYGVQLKQGMPVTDITPLENLSQFKVETERAFSGRTVKVDRHFHVNGKDHWFERYINPVRNKSGEIDRVTLWSIEVTERKLAEKALKDSESKFKKLAEVLPVGIYQIDEVGKCTYVNQSAQHIMGRSRTSLMDGTWADAIHVDDIGRVRSVWSSVESTMESYSVEYRYNRTDGNTVDLFEQTVPLFNHLGQYTGHLGTVVDITEQKKTQKLLQEKKIAERLLRFRSDFLASMSHEIRTPLNGIMGMSEVLLDTPLNEDQESKIQNILNASKDLRLIVNDVLDLSKLEAGKMILQKEDLNLSELLDLLLERYRPEAENKGLAFEIENLVGDLELNTDRRRITQVLSNLVRNAIKFTQKGIISVSVNNDNNGNLKFEVTDTGPGIPIKEQEKLFQDFSQLDHTTAQDLEGTGLGLSISKKLIQLLGGEIGVVSKPKQGSTFWFTVPIGTTANSTSKPKKHRKPKMQSVKDVRVLLVEDNLINQQAFKIMLKKMGCKVDVLSNGKQAVDNFDKSKYDIVFMDIQMPEMDGLQATTEIKKRFDDVPPVIGLSGNILQRDEDGNLKSDMDDLLMKPVVSHDIEMMIKKWVA